MSGKWRSGTTEISSARSAWRHPERFDLSRPENQRKLAAVEEFAVLADDIGLSLPELAIGWVLSHPAVTSAIIGPRTIEHLKGVLAAADVDLTSDVFERIDNIVPPGTNLDHVDDQYAPANAPVRRRTKSPG
jgi:aryl-alcohol dehydrogenase-like predicted oxidoreductase